jgi:hypothetical protein
LPGELVVSAAYVGTQTVHQLADRDINAAPPGGGPAGRPLAAKQGRQIAALMWDGWISGNYHSLQVAVNRRVAGGLFLKGAYTRSKAINWTDEDGWAGMPLTNWEPALRRNRAVAGYDRPTCSALGFLYELPFGRGRRWVNRGIAARLLGGWQTNGVLGAYSGTPFTVRRMGLRSMLPAARKRLIWSFPARSGFWAKSARTNLGSIHWRSASPRECGSGRPGATPCAGPGCGTWTSASSARFHSASG